MSDTSNSALDRLVELASIEATAGAAAASAALSGEGSPDCADCGRVISAARREAMPAAKRCVICQELAEGAR